MSSTWRAGNSARPFSESRNAAAFSLPQSRLPVLHHRELLRPALADRQLDENALPVAGDGQTAVGGRGQLKERLSRQGLEDWLSADLRRRDRPSVDGKID